MNEFLEMGRKSFLRSQLLSSLVALLIAGFIPTCLMAQGSVGGGDVANPASGPGPSHGLGGGGNFVMVKNWDFGTSANSTIQDMDDMTTHFQYHDQFGTFANGTKYGAYIVRPQNSPSHSYGGVQQPVEGIQTDRAVREFTEESLKTYIVPLRADASSPTATAVHPTNEKAGSGSFQAKFKLPKGGSRLGQDMIWETRVRYETPKYFWFAIWNSGNKWNNGAEIDLIESFGYDNGGGFTNYDGHYWHSSSVGGVEDTNYHSNWGNAMRSYGITNYDATQWHTWTMVYRADNTFTNYVDGIEVQGGTLNWTLGGGATAEALNMSFIFDGAWGHKDISSVNKWLDASELEDVYYEWDYSRIYLSAPLLPGDFNQDGAVDAADYTVWRDALGSDAGTLPNDTTGEAIGQAQYDLWKQNCGTSGSEASSVLFIPEPSLGCYLMVTLLLPLSRRFVQ